MRVVSVQLLVPDLLHGFLAAFLASQSGFMIVSHAAQVAILAGRRWPDHLSSLRERPHPAGLVLITDDAEVDAPLADQIKVLGLVSMEASSDHLLRAVTAAARSETYRPPFPLGGLPAVGEARGGSAPTLPVRLSRREREVAELAAQGLSNAEIGERLCIAVTTVKSHLMNVFDKLGITQRLQLCHHLPPGEPWLHFAPPPPARAGKVPDRKKSYQNSYQLP